MMSDNFPTLPYSSLLSERRANGAIWRLRNTLDLGAALDVVNLHLHSVDVVGVAAALAYVARRGAATLLQPPPDAPSVRTDGGRQKRACARRIGIPQQSLFRVADS